MKVDEAMLKRVCQKLIDMVDGTGSSASAKIGTALDCDEENQLQIFLKVSACEDDFIDCDNFICITFD